MFETDAEGRALIQEKVKPENDFGVIAPMKLAVKPPHAASVLLDVRKAAQSLDIPGAALAGKFVTCDFQNPEQDEG